MMPIPAKLLKAGVKDIVRISDARMSGTSFGAVVLHVSPEAAAGGPGGWSADGDMIEMDVAERRLELLIPPEELAQRLAEWRKPEAMATPGYVKLYCRHGEPGARRRGPGLPGGLDGQRRARQPALKTGP